MASSAALKMSAACLLLLCIASDLARPSLASLPSLDGKDQAAAGLALLRELMEHELAEELGLAGHRDGDGGDLRDLCSSACQTCLIVCAVTCVLIKEPIACFANCTVNSSCFGKPVAALPMREAVAQRA